jgi:carboxyl-terminal processing protease
MSRRNLLAIAFLTGICLLCWQNTQGAKPKDEMMELYGVFVDAVEQVEANYVRKVDRRELVQNALRGMLQELDPHSSYFTDADWKQFKKQIDGSFSGIGVSLEIDDETERLRVLAPLPGTPAYAAGILPGDIVLEIDGQSTEGMTRDKAIEALQGLPGTSVKLQVLHTGTSKTDTFTVTRAIVEVPSVLGDRRKPDDSWDFMLDKDKKVGYIRITNFTPTTVDDMKKALAELKADGMAGLILDLRDDPGGLLTAAVEMADLFLEKGLIVTTKGRNQRDQVYEAVKDGTFELPQKGVKFPMVVLINQGSASASEIVAASLQDNERAKVVGHRSFGKGSVQNLLPLDNGDSILKLTVATYYRPSGKNIHRFKNAKESEEWGVSPSPGLEVNLSEKEYISLLENRRERDLIMRVNQPKSSDVKKGEEEPGKPKPAAEVKGEQTKPASFVDRQLNKALEVVRTQIAESSSTARK